MKEGPTRTAAVILAAGASRRFGSPKPLAAWGDTTLLGNAVRVAEGAGCDPVVVVLGGATEEITPAVPESAAVVWNPHWADGPGTSLAAGLRFLTAASEPPGRVVVLPVDLPLVTAADVRAATKYRAAARQARAFARLAALHEARQMPSPLFTVRTRRHVRTLLAAETFTAEVEAALKSALRWTRGLPMRQRTGFGIMHEGFERLGLLAPVVLPLAVAEAIGEGTSPQQPAAPPSGDSLPARTGNGAPAAVVVEVAEASEPSVEGHPVMAEASATPSRSGFTEEATARAAEGWIGHVTQFSEIDFAEAFAAGLSLSHAVEAAQDWITGAVVFGPLPFAWGEADGTGRPFWRDAAGRLRTGKPTGGEPPVEGGAPNPDPTGGGREGAAAATGTPRVIDV